MLFPTDLKSLLQCHPRLLSLRLPAVPPFSFRTLLWLPRAAGSRELVGVAVFDRVVSRIKKLTTVPILEAEGEEKGPWLPG